MSASKTGATTIASVTILDLAGAGAVYVLNYQIITAEGATAASTVTYLLPVFAIILGVTVLSETITLAIAGEITLILAGVTLTRRHQQAKQPADQHP